MYSFRYHPQVLVIIEKVNKNTVIQAILIHPGTYESLSNVKEMCCTGIKYCGM